nr:RHS repeat-associated core domain-containing protein [Paenibacillus sp. YX.27]
MTEEADSFRNAFRYAGEYWDSDTGLQYLRARWYDPSTGRFITEDTWEGRINHPDSQNPYVYVVNNPLRYVDPSGKCFWDACILEGAVAYATAAAVVTVVAGIVTGKYLNDQGINIFESSNERSEYPPAKRKDYSWIVYT